MNNKPKNAKIAAINQDVEETKDIMADNIDKMTQTLVCIDYYNQT